MPRGRYCPAALCPEGFMSSSCQCPYAVGVSKTMKKNKQHIRQLLRHMNCKVASSTDIWPRLNITAIDFNSATNIKKHRSIQ